jgi:hypothetical protein
MKKIQSLDQEATQLSNEASAHDPSRNDPPLYFCNKAFPQDKVSPRTKRPLDKPPHGLPGPWLTVSSMKRPLDKPSPGWHVPLNFVTKRTQMWGRTVCLIIKTLINFFVTKHPQRQVCKICWFTQWFHLSSSPFTWLINKKTSCDKTFPWRSRCHC